MDKLKFRKTLSKYATGVTIVTTRTKTKDLVGITMTSFNSLSLEPPLILFSIIKQSLSLEIFKNSNNFIINILSREQEELSNKFAKSGTDKWLNVNYSLGYKDNPRLNDTLAYFECDHYANYDGGDHLIFLGKVIHFEFFENKEPLIFFEAKYHATDGKNKETLPDWPLDSYYF